MADVVVVGAGVGGLCAAIRLSAVGHRVVVVERLDEPGGKLAARRRDGFSFDTGPSLLTLPQVFDEVLALAGMGLGDHASLVRLDPQFRYHWPGGATLEVRDDPELTEKAFDGFRPGAGAVWRSFDRHGQRIWDVSERTFLAGGMDAPLDLVRRMRSLRDLAAIDALRPLASAAAVFPDPRLQQWVGRYATYSGSSPFLAPATLACIPAIEARYGTWYLIGGIVALRDALVAAATKVGAELVLGVDVARIETSGGRVRGVRLAGGDRLGADVVVANTDAEHLYGELLPDARALARVRRAAPSTSGLVVLAGVDGATPGLAHHNVWFSADDRSEFDDLVRRRRLPSDPTIYGCVSSITDPTQAPPGAENWFLLVNAPAGWDGDPAAARDDVLASLTARGVDLAGRARFTEVIAPRDFATRYRSPGGAIYGTSSNGRRAAFLRPANRGPRRGLYLVGGSSHPGGGLPLVATSAKIVAGMIEDDGW